MRKNIYRPNSFFLKNHHIRSVYICSDEIGIHQSCQGILSSHIRGRQVSGVPPFLLMVKGIVDKDVTSQQYPGDPCDEYRDALMVIYTLIEGVIAEFITMPDIPVFPGDIMVGDLPKGPF